MDKKSTVFFLFSMCSILMVAQPFCKVKSIESIDNITFDTSKFIKKDTTVDEIKYSHYFYCKKNKITVYGCIDSNNIKNGRWALYDGKYWIVGGKYLNDKKEGWWEYEDCCRTNFKEDKRVGHFCATFY